LTIVFVSLIHFFTIEQSHRRHWSRLSDAVSRGTWCEQ
jgi:hypothetical protein